jgi:DNA-binding beta-propeller fold protein YncE
MVGNVVSNSISILNSENNTLASTTDVNSLPLALEFNPSNKAVYVAGTLTGTDGLVSPYLDHLVKYVSSK